jgi:hypothetical protein
VGARRHAIADAEFETGQRFDVRVEFGTGLVAFVSGHHRQAERDVGQRADRSLDQRCVRGPRTEKAEPGVTRAVGRVEPFAQDLEAGVHAEHDRAVVDRTGQAIRSAEQLDQARLLRMPGAAQQVDVGRRQLAGICRDDARGHTAQRCAMPQGSRIALVALCSRTQGVEVRDRELCGHAANLRRSLVGAAMATPAKTSTGGALALARGGCGRIYGLPALVCNDARLQYVVGQPGVSGKSADICNMRFGVNVRSPG